MNVQKFNAVLTARIAKTRAVLAAKSAEYSTTEDKLHNFKRAAEMQRVSPEEALRGMWAKHVISILDIIDTTAPGSERSLPPAHVTDEKIGDAVNYLILLEALLIERYENNSGKSG